MSDIFISYAKEDREWVVSFAGALRKHGWTVWWDRSIPFGQSFQEVIETELDEAKCAIVVWSDHSVGSGWVSAEADEARNRNIMMPVLIDDASPPLVFRQLQTANLKDWNNDTSSPIFKKLIADLSMLIGQPTKQPEPPQAPVSEAAPAHQKKVAMWPWLTGLVGMFIIAVLWFFNEQETGSPVVQPPIVDSFRLDSDHINVGDALSLIWNTSGASTVEIKELGEVAHSGSFVVRPEKTSVYTLIARNSHGDSTQASVRVVVEQRVVEKPTEETPDPAMLISLINESLEEGRPDLAEEFLEKAIKMSPDHPEVLKIGDRLETERQAQQLAEDKRQKDQAEKIRKQEQQLAEQQRAEEDKQNSEKIKWGQMEETRLAEIKKQKEAEQLAFEELRQEKESQKLAEEQRRKEEEIKKKAEKQRLADIESRKKIEEERLQKEVQQKKEIAEEQKKEEQQRREELEKQQALAAPASIVVKVDGVEKRFNRNGLLASTLRENVVQQLQAAGFNVVSMAEAKKSKDSIVMLLAFKYIENTSAGFYSYTARTIINSTSSIKDKPLWVKGQTGTARSVELRKVNGVFATNVEQFIRDHPEKGLEFRKN